MSWNLPNVSFSQAEHLVYGIIILSGSVFCILNIHITSLTSICNIHNIHIRSEQDNIQDNIPERARSFHIASTSACTLTSTLACTRQRNRGHHITLGVNPFNLLISYRFDGIDYIKWPYCSSSCVQFYTRCRTKRSVIPQFIPQQMQFLHIFRPYYVQYSHIFKAVLGEYSTFSREISAYFRIFLQ